MTGRKRKKVGKTLKKISSVFDIYPSNIIKCMVIYHDVCKWFNFIFLDSVIKIRTLSCLCRKYAIMPHFEEASIENFVRRCTFITSNSIVLTSSPTSIDDYYCLQLQTNLRTSKSFQGI